MPQGALWKRLKDCKGKKIMEFAVRLHLLGMSDYLNKS